MSPRVTIADEGAVVNSSIAELGTRGGTIWRQANTIQIRRMELVWTDRGKLMPLHLGKRPQEQAGEGGRAREGS